MRHIITVEDFREINLLQLFNRVEIYKRGGPKIIVRSPFQGRILGSLFYEPSTRTRFSFEAAMLRLGGNYISTENAMEFSSAAKGETLEDSIRVVSGYCDVIVLRHPENGAADRAAQVACVPLINAGDGAHEHPTQALLDFFTIWEACKSGALPGEPLHLVFFGDNLYSRAVRSLIQMLIAYGGGLGIRVGRMTFGGIPGRSNPALELMQRLENKGISVEISPFDMPLDGDVYYLTRLQRERGDLPSAEIKPFLRDKESRLGRPADTRVRTRAETGNLEAETMSDSVVQKLKRHAMILHPLPRTSDLSPLVDRYPQAQYFEQAQNGLYVRMALLELLLK